MEKILSVKESTFLFSNRSHCGYVIVTDKRTIKIGVVDSQQCCEQYGYICSNDNLTELSGLNLISLNVVNQAMNKEMDVKVYDGGIVFVDLETSNGLYQFAVYNSQNGYYGHKAVVLSGEEVIEETTI